MYINAMDAILLAFWLEMMMTYHSYALLLNQEKKRQNGGRYNEMQ